MPSGHGGSPAMKITALAAGFVMASVDATVMQIAGATVQERLHAPLSRLTWAVDGYVLTFAALLMLAGGLAGRLGARRVYLAGMAVFLAASLAAALAPAIEVLIAARLVQGAGAALFMPSSLALLVDAFPDPRRRTRVLGLWSAIVSSSIALGPTVGGVLVSTLGWRAIFLINVPLAIAGMALARRHIAPVPGRPAPLALPGHAALAAGLGALSFALIEGPHRGWTSLPVLAAIAVVLGVAALLPLREHRARTTVMPWALFRKPRFTGANAVGFLFNAAFFGTLFLVGLYFQHGTGAGPLRAGLMVLPMTVFLPLSNLAFAHLSGRVNSGLLLTVSLLAAAAASFALTTITPSSPYWTTAAALAATGIAGGIVSPAMTAAMVEASGPGNGNVAGSVLNTGRQIGTLIGIALIGAVLGASTDWTTAATIAFSLVGAAYLTAALAAWRLIARPERTGRPAPHPIPEPAPCSHTRTA
ncbi:DHA2 family methylenomycin A resistance protein-like MFS transporter [Actinomadura luteofluorescens]|uniref:DHA2 family methylenomycin A resistance protein-like MFS transporter n=1 Tax=Actinomadura luteofluorescens TaxID=46163 RepID=A0A7Y9EMT0_9ACTN|nr:MFS transporter [Actinomadura luteofluorescens]NYD50612.1 DHA2 family methylenomycin A resistance protein-like MFS transporter [Actinomadura luteofluorescens]